MKVIQFLIHSNIYIAFAALLLTLSTQVILNIPLNWHPYLFLIFFATLFEYNLHRLITIFFYPESLQNTKHEWVRNNLKFFYAMMLFSLLGFMVCLFMAKWSVLLTLSPLAVLTLFYSTPISKTGKTLFRLRQIPFLKIFLIAIVWSLTTILLPLIYENNQFILNKHIVLMIAERALFIFSITIPFDIRDMREDKESQLKTIPILLGKQKSILLGIICLLLFLGLAFYHYMESNHLMLIVFCVTAILTEVCLTSKKLQSSSLYHYGILDGLMILHPALIILTSFFA